MLVNDLTDLRIIGSGRQVWQLQSTCFLVMLQWVAVPQLPRWQPLPQAIVLRRWYLRLTPIASVAVTTQSTVLHHRKEQKLVHQIQKFINHRNCLYQINIHTIIATSSEISNFVLRMRSLPVTLQRLITPT